MNRELNPNIGPNKDNSKELVTEGTVTSIANYYINGTIKVRTYEKTTVDCRPLLPIYLLIVPRVGDSVNLLLRKTNSSSNYLWCGPIITDYKKLNSSSKVKDQIHLHSKSITKFPNARGIYPSLEDITYNGRWNSDIRLGKNQTLIRAGFHKIDNNEEYNQTNQNYSLLRLSKAKDGNIKGTHTIVGEFINLLSQKGTPHFELGDRDEVITEEVMQDILNNAHPAVFGDNLIDFLKLLVKFVATHQHNYHNMPPSKFENEIKIENFDLNGLVSKNIKLN